MSGLSLLGVLGGIRLPALVLQLDMFEGDGVGAGIEVRTVPETRRPSTGARYAVHDLAFFVQQRNRDLAPQIGERGARDALVQPLRRIGPGR